MSVLSDAHKDFVFLVKAGRSAEELSKIFNIHVTTINKYAKDNNLSIYRPPRKPRTYKRKSACAAVSLLTVQWKGSLPDNLWSAMNIKSDY